MKSTYFQTIFIFLIGLNLINECFAIPSSAGSSYGDGLGNGNPPLQNSFSSKKEKKAVIKAAENKARLDQKAADQTAIIQGLHPMFQNYGANHQLDCIESAEKHQRLAESAKKTPVEKPPVRKQGQ